MSRADATLASLTSSSASANAALANARARPQFRDTALQPTDDAPSFDDDGYTFVRPSFDEEDMLRSFESPDAEDAFARLSPQEAYEHMKYMAPLDADEIDILNATPFLEPGMTWADSPDHEQWLIERSREKYGAMDNVLEDQMYGDILNNDHIARAARVLRAQKARAGARAPASRTSGMSPAQRERYARAFALAPTDVIGALRIWQGRTRGQI